MKKAWIKYIKLYHERPAVFAQSDELKIVLDYDQVLAFERNTGQHIGVIYESPYNTLVVDLVQNAEGKQFAYERILPTVEHGAIVAIPVFKDKFVLLNQYRHAIRDFQYAFPRGYGEDSVIAEDNAKKELLEEIGANVLQIKKLGVITVDSGLCSNKADAFACVVDRIELHSHHEGIKDIVLLSKDEFEQWISLGKINDSFSLSAYSLYLQKQQE